MCLDSNNGTTDHGSETSLRRIVTEPRSSASVKNVKRPWFENPTELNENEASSTPRMTIADLLKKAQSLQLRTEMEVFLSHLLSCSRLDLVAYSEQSVPVDKLSELQQGWVQIQKGFPVAYLTHSKEFYGLDFYVDERVLVPRDATEILVDLVLQKASHDASIIEVGTGSGAISVAVKHERPDLKVIAGDISPEVLEVARINAERHQVQVDFYESDLLESLPEVDAEILVANLPYIGEVEHRYIADNVEAFEPHLALFGGHDGLRLYERLFEQAHGRSFPWIMGEIGFSQGMAIEALAKEFLPGYGFSLIQDREGLDRIFVLCYNAPV